MTGPESGTWRERGRLFDTAAQDYLDGRPGYPQQVFELLRRRCGLHAGASVLEIGPGAGQATVPMLEAGARVTAVEPGAALAEALVLRAGSAHLDVIVDRFESVQLPPASFDLLVSATAFHWVDPTVGIPKSAQLLRPGGWLVLWWTVWGRPDRYDSLHERLLPLLAGRAPQLLTEGPAAGRYALAIDERIADIQRTHRYGPVEYEIIDWTGRHDAVQARALFASFSPWLALPARLRVELLDEIERIVRTEFDDHIEREYQTVLYAAQRLDDPATGHAQTIVRQP